MSKLTLIRGIPGAGKSTLADMLVLIGKSAGVDTVHYEADQLFMKNGKYEFNASLLSQAHELCQQNTFEALGNGKSVVVANTFVTIKELKPYFQIAKDFDLVPHVILCQSNYGSVHGVPEDTLRSMRKKFVYDLSPLFELLKNETVS